LGPDEAPESSGNTFRADENGVSMRSGNWGGPWVDMTWLSPTQLRVRYAAKSRVFKHQVSISGVTVIYEAVRF
jgi:hypothetical protein